MWSLFQDKKELKPLVFSNGKTQEDVVKEVLDAIKQGYKIIFIKGQCGTGKCLDKDSLIFCKPNNEDYFSYYKISELLEKEGKISSLDKEGNIIESKFKNVRKNGKKRLYKLITRTGREIIASQNHPFFTITDKGLEWLPLKNLNNKSYICLPNKISLNNSLDFEDNKIKVLAHLIAEGKLGDSAGSPGYTQDPVQNPDIRGDYISSLKNLFPEGEIKEYKKDIKINFRLMDTRFGTTNKLRLLIRDHGLDGKKSNEKFVPKIIFNLRNEKIALFLRILYSCDGSIYEKSNRKSKQTIIEYCSISDRLIKDVSILLSILGISHTITKRKFQDMPDYSKRITVSNQKGIRDFIEKIGFIGRKQELALKIYRNTKIHKFTNIDKVPRAIRDYLKNKGYSYFQLDRFLNYEKIEEKRKILNYKQIRNNHSIKTPCVFNQGKIDFLREHLRTINKYLKDDILSFICNESIIWDKIKSIDYLKEEETYDLEVENYNNFIANGIIVHNSAIALNLARNIGKTSIVVPIKSLQEQYIRDYTEKLYLLDKENKRRLRISSIVGRKNFPCRYLEEDNFLFSEFGEEKNANLFDIFSSKPKSKKIKSCDNNYLPCKIEISEKNARMIKKYIKQNPLVRLSNFDSINKVKRMTIAPACLYWSPIIPDEFDMAILKNAEKFSYTGLKKKRFAIYQRKQGCPYYNQYLAYPNSDIIIFNSSKYLLETLMDRKPQTELEIIDECDEFLDSLANEEQVNIRRVLSALIFALPENRQSQLIINQLAEIANAIDKKYKPSDEIFEIKNTLVEELLLTFLKNPEFLDKVVIDESNYLCHLDEVARIFSDFFDETFFSIEKKEKDLIISLVTINLEKRLKSLFEKNKIIVMMSGTVHSEAVLKGIFGLDNFKIIEAETENLGKIIKCRQGYEINCRYTNFQSEQITRKRYLKTFSKSVEFAKPPVLVHLTSFSDLPKDYEKEKFNINNLPSQSELIEEQERDPFGKRISDFKNKKTKILFTTKCTRGMDFPGDICNSIVISKFPYPNISSIFWKILKKTKPNYFRSFYLDKARRELLQRIYRGLRSKNDKIYLFSPDIRVLEFADYFPLSFLSSSEPKNCVTK